MSVGIVGYGSYVPRLRLSRKAVAQANAWFAPQHLARARGTRAMANWDEDSITMALAAARDSLGSDTSDREVLSLLLASSTLPFAERLNSAVVGAALGLDESISASDIQARAGGRLLEYRSERRGDGGDRTLEMTCAPDGCRAVIRTEGGEEVRNVPSPGDTAEQADPFRLAAARRGTVEGRQIKSEHLRVKVMKDAFLRRDRIAGAGVEIPVSLLSEAEEGDRVVAEVAVADDGRVVQIRFGNSLTARAEPEEVAKRLDRIDLFSLSRVPLEGPLPRSVPQRIVFRLKGVPAGFSEQDARQSFAPGPAGETVVTVAASLPAAAAR